MFVNGFLQFSDTSTFCTKTSVEFCETCTLVFGACLWYNIGKSEKGGGRVALRYKVDVLAKLKEKGFTTYKLRTEKIMGEAMLQKLRQHQMVSWATIEKLCELLQCQIVDIIEYIPEKTD